jgi:hypothetical protein
MFSATAFDKLLADPPQLDFIAVDSILTVNDPRLQGVRKIHLLL